MSAGTTMPRDRAELQLMLATCFSDDSDPSPSAETAARTILKLLDQVGALAKPFARADA
jgi:hypothetical protein